MLSDEYAYAKAKCQMLRAQTASLSEILKSFPRGALGLTPDSVKASSDWQAAKKAYDLAFRLERSHNAVFVRRFAREYRAERRAKSSRS